jgi:hypothetical protein
MKFFLEIIKRNWSSRAAIFMALFILGLHLLSVWAG